MLFVFPPTTSINEPTNKPECWYLAVGLVFSGALTQSQLPFRCLRKPQLSLRGLLSLALPPKMTTMPEADPAVQRAEE